MTGSAALSHLRSTGLAMVFGALAAMGAPRMSEAQSLRAPRPDRLQGLSPDGDLLLAAGGLARLACLRLPETQPHRARAQAWLRARADKPLRVHGGTGRDRWNRAAVRIVQADSPLAPDWAQELIEAGLALADFGPGEACRPDLLAFEKEARRQRLGLWADAHYNFIDIRQKERLRDRIGSFVLIEGRVLSVGERKRQTYLNFGRNWAEDFTIVIPQRIWKQMVKRGLDAGALQGHRIRARGVLQPWQGTVLTIAEPDMIERP